MNQLVRNLRQIMTGRRKLVLILNYHRVGPSDPANPFHRLHTVTPATFRQQISYLARLGRFVSLAEIRSFDGLGKINFSLSFDDVSQSIFSIKDFLSEREIPYTIAPCTAITGQGQGVRDKVYFIEKLLDPEQIFDFVQQTLGREYPLRQETFKFYKFTKSAEVDPDVIEEKIILPLFESIPELERSRFGKAYLSWDDIKTEFLPDPLVTVANHSYRHLNMAGLSRDAILRDVRQSYADFQTHLDFKPLYYAVPFGRVTQDLVYDLNEFLRSYGCRGVLWVNGGGNLLGGPFHEQMLHLSRIHTPASLFKTGTELLASFGKIHRDILSFIPRSYLPDEQPFQVLAYSDRDKALSYENLVRYNKDYSSKPSFYEYCFTRNPFKNKRPDYYAAVCNQRIHSIGYNFHSRFVLHGAPVAGVYWGNWRQSKQTVRASGGHTLRKTLGREAVVGFYNPSPDATPPAKTKRWKKIAVHAYQFDPERLAVFSPESETAITLENYLCYPAELNPLLEEVNRRVLFSIHRSPEFYAWRFDCYPLAKTSYWVASKENNPVGYFVLLHKSNTAHLADFYCQSLAVFLSLLKQCHLFCREKAIQRFYLETSRAEISHWVEQNLAVKASTFFNYYAFNGRHLPGKNVQQNIEDRWADGYFHETQACGDVLLR